MKLFLTAILIIGAFSVLNAQNTKTTTDTTKSKLSLKQELSGHKWKYIGMEKFKDKTKADSTQKKDMITLNEDMTFTQVEGKQNYAGVWSVNETSRFLSMTDAATKATRTMKVVKIINGQLILSFQDADLVTYYKFYLRKD